MRAIIELCITYKNRGCHAQENDHLPRGKRVRRAVPDCRQASYKPVHIEGLLRPHVLDTALDDGYKAMAADQEREAEAEAWCAVTK